MIPIPRRTQNKLSNLNNYFVMEIYFFFLINILCFPAISENRKIFFALNQIVVGESTFFNYY